MFYNDQTIGWDRHLLHNHSSAYLWVFNGTVKPEQLAADIKDINIRLLLRWSIITTICINNHTDFLTLKSNVIHRKKDMMSASFTHGSHVARWEVSPILIGPFQPITEHVLERCGADCAISEYWHSGILWTMFLISFLIFSNVIFWLFRKKFFCLSRIQ